MADEANDVRRELQRGNAEYLHPITSRDGACKARGKRALLWR
jgi:hypothetical protein